MLAVHTTHEAQRKFGGIGAVLNGLIPSQAYDRLFDRTLVYGPLFETETDLSGRFSHHGEVLYSGPDGFDAGEWTAKLKPIEEKYGVSLVYGRREIFSQLSPDKRREVDLLLMDSRAMKPAKVDELKFIFWERFGLDSKPFDDWDYEQYLRLAGPYPDILEILYPEQPALHLAHEYMGIPASLRIIAGQQDGLRPADRTFFHAHEVSPARSVVERIEGHDSAFDNLCRMGLRDGRTMEEDFGSQADYYRAELVKRVEHFHGVLAVGDNVKDQLLYFWPPIGADKIEVVYNGFNFQPIDLMAKRRARATIQDYCETLLNYRPDVIITHVTRLVISKGLWRDLKLLYYLDELMARMRLKGFYLCLATQVTTGRTSEEILRMEAEYGWPVLHKDGFPDLDGQEKPFADFLALFNARSKAIKGIFLNQFGFSPERCGRRVPEGADRLTLRAAADLELGLSVYEPFGIAQLETFAYGGLPIVSRACGCSYLLDAVAPDKTFSVIDFAAPNGTPGFDPDDRDSLLKMTMTDRERIEEAAVQNAARSIFGLLRPGGEEARFKIMSQAAPAMGWEAITERIVEAVEKRL